MALVLPVAVEGRLVGSAIFVDRVGPHLLFATCLHLFGKGTDIRVVIPPHGGNLTAVQQYPLISAPALQATILLTDPFSDLALLHVEDATAQTPPAVPMVSAPRSLMVGAEVVVLGYPFAPIGSFLETWTPAHVTALAERQVAPGVGVNELVLSATGHPGLSGAAVMGSKDGLLHGVLRGSLSPPETLRIGDIPIATDTSVTFASSAHYLVSLLASARKRMGI